MPEQSIIPDGIDARMRIENFQRQFNEVRPSLALENLTPAEFKKTLSTANSDKAIFRTLEMALHISRTSSLFNRRRTSYCPLYAAFFKYPDRSLALSQETRSD